MFRCNWEACYCSHCACPGELSRRATSEVQCVGRVVRMEYREGGCIGYRTWIDLRHGAGAARETFEMVEAVGGGKPY